MRPAAFTIGILGGLLVLPVDGGAPIPLDNVVILAVIAGWVTKRQPPPA
jgi:hypothetical protein